MNKQTFATNSIKKVFVSGGAGFIGSHLVDRMVEQGWIITVYDNLSSGKEEFIEKHIGQNYFRFIKADLMDLPRLKESIVGHNLVFHLSANPDIRYGIEHTVTDLTQNTIVTYNILEAMRLAEIKEIAFSSTSTVYGEPKVLPTPEDYGPLYPISLYGASKLACEALCTAFAHTFNMKCWIFRFANIIGGRATHGLIFDLINKLKKNSEELEILGDGKQTKSYLLVDDCVSAMLYCYENSREQFNVFNLGCSDRIDITTIAELLVKKMGLEDVKFDFTGGERGWPGDVPQMFLDIDKLCQIGWKSKYNSRQAVEIAIERIVEECKQ